MWFSEPYDTTSLHACPSVYNTWCVPGGHPSNYEPGPVKSLIRNGVISGMGCQVRVRCMRRVWCAVVGEGVGGNGKYYRCAWVNGHHPDFLSTRICQLKQLSDTTTDLTENKKARTKIPFEDVRHYLKYAEYADS